MLEIKLYADSCTEAMDFAEAKYDGTATRCYRDLNYPDYLDRWVVYLKLDTQPKRVKT